MVAHRQGSDQRIVNKERNMAKQILSAEYLRERLTYNPETGEFLHRHSFGNRYHAGERADTPGHAALKGYRLVNLLSQKFLAHRAAWLYLHGVWPDKYIDHINGNRGDNRIENLRDVVARTNQENQRVAKVNNKTGFLGVRMEQGLYRARIKANGKTLHIGMFEKAEDASAAYIKAKRELHAGCTI